MHLSWSSGGLFLSETWTIDSPDALNHSITQKDCPLQIMKFQRIFIISAGLSILLSDSTNACEWDAFFLSTRDYFKVATLQDVNACLEAGSNPVIRDYWGFSPLHWAAAYNSDPAVVQALIDEGADPQAGNKADVLPIHMAARYNANPAVLARLLAAGSNLEARDILGRTPLMVAVRLSHSLPVLELLVDAGADLQTVDNSLYGNTPLHWAMQNDEFPQLAVLLLEAGADPTAPDVFGLTPLHHASNRTNAVVFEAIWRTCATRAVATCDYRTPQDLEQEKTAIWRSAAFERRLEKMTRRGWEAADQEDLQ